MNNIVYAGKHALTLAVSRHAHSHWEVIYCTSGTGQLIFDHCTMTYHADDIAIIPPMMAHTNASEEGFTNIHLNLSDCSLTNREPLLITKDENKSMEPIFNSAFYFYSVDPDSRTSLLQAFGNLIVTYAELSQPSQVKNEIVQQIEAQIIHNYPNYNYDLAEYLHTLPFSYDYLIKLFKKELGVTPHKYLTELRLRSAADWLRNSQGNNVSEIAHICGFKEPLYFSRLFKKKYGVSPSIYASASPVYASDSDSMKIMMQETEG